MPGPREYEITVSAMLGRSAAAVFGPFIADAHRAKAQIDAILGAPVKAARTAGGKDPRVSEAEKASKELERIREKENNAILGDVERMAKAEERAHEGSLRKIAAIKERYFREEQQRGEKADAERQQRNERIISGSLSNMRKVASVATRIAGEVVGGMGVETSLSSLIGRGVRNESLAAKISGYGYIEGEKGPAGVRQDPKAILEDARRAAQAAKLDTGEVLEGLGEFTKKSSELGLGRDILKDIAVFAKATGSDFKAVASSAGDLAKKLGDIPNKAEAVKASLSILAKEGKFGAIDFSDLAKLIPTVIGGSNQFAQGSAAAISQLGVALQITKSFGGAKNPAQAATSVASFVGDLTSKAGLKSLTAAGIDPFANAEKTKLKSVEDILVMALEKSGGDLSKMSAMFSNKRSGSVLKGFGQIYSEAEEKQKGAGGQAVRDIFKSYGAQTSQKDLAESFKVNAATTESQVIEFNNTLEEVANDLRADLLPTLKELAPVAKEAAQGFAFIVKEAAEHPVAAIMAAIAGSIAKAAIGETAGKALGTALASMGGKGLAIGALTATAVTAYLYLRKSFDEAQEGQTQGLKNEVAAQATPQLARDVAAGRVSKEEALKKLEETYASGSKQLKLAEKGVGFWDVLTGDSKDVGAAQELQRGNEEGAARIGGKTSMEAFKADLAGVKESIDALKTQMAADAKTVKKVEVINQPGPTPTAPTGGTVQQ